MKMWYFFGMIDRSGVTAAAPRGPHQQETPVEAHVKATTDGEWGTTCGACRLVRIVGSAGVHFHIRMTSEVA
jgi:hypothetical protein